MTVPIIAQLYRVLSNFRGLAENGLKYGSGVANRGLNRLSTRSTSLEKPDGRQNCLPGMAASRKAGLRPVDRLTIGPQINNLPYTFGHEIVAAHKEMNE